MPINNENIETHKLKRQSFQNVMRCIKIFITSFLCTPKSQLPFHSTFQSHMKNRKYYKLGGKKAQVQNRNIDEKIRATMKINSFIRNKVKSAELKHYPF